MRAKFQSTLSGTNNSALVSSTCTQSNPQAPRPNGGIFVIDIAKAVSPSSLAGNVISGSVIASFASACSPVRAAESPNGSMLWVVARGSNEIISFNVANILDNPNAAFVAATPSGGQAPVGITFMDGGNKIMVTNSNRFDSDSAPTDANENAALFDVSSNGTGTLLQTLATGLFPRDVSVSPDGSTAAVTSYKSDLITLYHR